ncbi:MAG TPA: methyltransferase domain-containing protein [Phycisphaerae bacterium]|nr:methyltransferase domain-containing protein [Phycisphaerae bacterium]HRW54330.1 methyltransferase domain-containing protein [Phycisphaerae bacterium]
MTQKSTEPAVGDSAVFSADLQASRGLPAQDGGIFLKKFLQKGKGISAATPSSRFLSEAVCNVVDFSKPSTIVEVGAGTGAITEVILENLRSHHRFVMLEFDPDFCDILRQRYPSVDLIQGDVGEIEGPLASRGITKVDYVLSGLPTPNLPPRSLAKMMRWLRRSLTPDGVFSQITVIPLYYKSFYKQLFADVQYEMVWLNAPPGGVYYCRSPRRRVRRGARRG